LTASDIELILTLTKSEMMRDDAKLLCRLPPEIKGFLERQSAKFGSSMNSEIVRSIRERMDRVEKEMPASAGE
jgi:hypothetical protein